MFGAVAVVLSVFVGVIVASRGRYERRVVFPESPPVTRLAIRAPLVRPDLTVMATLKGSPKHSTPLWMTVDSGATGVTMPADAFHALGLDVLRGVTVRQEDPSGRVIVRDAGLIPQLDLGDLVLEEVVTALGGGTTILGQSVLAHAPWEIDWDRGLLTLGSAPWPIGGDTLSLPLRKVGDADVVTIHVDGAPIEMVLDTGAFASMIPERVGGSSQLATRRIPPTVMHSLGGEVIVRRLFSGEVRLAGRALGRNEFVAIQTGGRRAGLGLLGLDVLSRFQLQVVPGSHLALRPRGDVRKFTAERIARWSFVPTTCEHVGCVHASLAPKDSDAQLTVTLDADLDRPIEVLLGCANDHADTFVPTGSSFAFGAPPEVARHVRVRLPTTKRGTTSETVIQGGARWFSASGADCHVLQALDVSPLTAFASTADNESSDSELQATLWP